MTCPYPIDLSPFIHQVRNSELLPWTGDVVELVGMLIASRGPAVAVGDFCEVATSSGRRIRTQVIGFLRDGHVLSMPLEEIDGIQLGDRVVARQDDAQVAVGPDLVGRVLDGLEGRLIANQPSARHPSTGSISLPVVRWIGSIGLGSVAHPHPLQQAFIDEQAAQCGYCMNGMIMTAKVLLDKNPRPTEVEIKQALEGNLCRCGSHLRVVRAVKRAAGEKVEKA